MNPVPQEGSATSSHLYHMCINQTSRYGILDNIEASTEPVGSTRTHPRRSMYRMFAATVGQFEKGHTTNIIQYLLELNSVIP